MNAVDDRAPDSRVTVWEPTFKECSGDGRTRDPSRVRVRVSDDQNASSISAMSSAKESSIPSSAASL